MMSMYERWVKKSRCIYMKYMIRPLGTWNGLLKIDETDSITPPNDSPIVISQLDIIFTNLTLLDFRCGIEGNNDNDNYKFYKNMLPSDMSQSFIWTKIIRYRFNKNFLNIVSAS